MLEKKNNTCRSEKAIIQCLCEGNKEFLVCY